MKTKLFLLFTSIIYLNTYAQFGPQQIITTNVAAPSSVYATDIDGDGDMDVLSASVNDDKIAWYENLHPLSVDQNTLVDFSVYPSPTKGLLTIKSNTTFSISGRFNAVYTLLYPVIYSTFPFQYSCINF